MIALQLAATRPASKLDGRGSEHLLSSRVLGSQNRRYRNTGGISNENRASGFAPAFKDSSTGSVYISRFADGRAAPMHLLEGLPSDLVVERDASGCAVAVHGSVIAGFVRDGRFYTRGQAAELVRRTSPSGV